MAYQGPTISCDSHIVEVPEIFAGLEARFGDEAPGIVYDPEKGEVLNLGSGKTFMVSIGRFGIAGHFANDPETQELIKQGYKGLRPGILDPLKRIDDQDLDGVDAEILLPSVLLGLNTIPNADIVAATYRNYNDWVYNYASQAPKRLFPTCCLPMHDVTWQSRSLPLKAMGHVGANIPCVPPLDKPYSDPYYNPFWAVAAELETPLVLHFLTSTQPNHGPAVGHGHGHAVRTRFIRHAARHRQHHRRRRCARFPKLKFVITEWETGWIAHFLQRMDWAFYAHYRTKPPELTEAFSFYWHQNFLGTFEDDRIGLTTRYDVGVENLMWGSTSHTTTRRSRAPARSWTTS